jgi:hypothetical protein
MLGFSLLQLVTSEPRAVAIPEAQLTQSLPCSFHVLATQHSIGSVYPDPTKCVSTSDHHHDTSLGFYKDSYLVPPRHGCWR